MAQILYWIAHPTALWPGVPTVQNILDERLSNNSGAEASGFETATDTSWGTRNVDEFTAITGLVVNTNYTIAAVIFDDVTLVYSNVSIGTETTFILSRPSSDVTSPGWSSTAPTLSAAINETVFEDSSFITSPNLINSTAPAVMELDTPLTPGTWAVEIRALKDRDTRSIAVALLTSANNVLATSPSQLLTANYTTYIFTLNITEIATRVRLIVQ